MKLSQSFAALVATVSLLGCEMEMTYKDVSNRAEHRDLIGDTCELLVPLRAHGVAKKLEQNQKTDYIIIWNPGFTGPEMTFFTLLMQGTRMRVLAARECANCLFDTVVDYQVAVVPEPVEFAGKPAFARIESFSPRHVRCDSDFNNSLKPKPTRHPA